VAPDNCRNIRRDSAIGSSSIGVTFGCGLIEVTRLQGREPLKTYAFVI
jgi:hypothetical protein